eukprot:1927074-Alexandrium_andersonii.AAC.1
MLIAWLRRGADFPDRPSHIQHRRVLEQAPAWEARRDARTCLRAQPELAELRALEGDDVVEEPRQVR